MAAGGSTLGPGGTGPKYCPLPKNFKLIKNN